MPLASYREMLARAGFEAVDVEPTRAYQVTEAKSFFAAAGIVDEQVLAQIDGRFMAHSSARGPQPPCVLFNGMTRSRVPHYTWQLSRDGSTPRQG
jgi:hypothetical protein